MTRGSVADVHRRGGGDPVARLEIRVDDGRRRAPSSAARRRARASAGSAGRAADGDHSESPWTNVGRSSSAEATAAVVSRERSRQRPATSATSAPATAIQVAHAGPPCSTVYPKSPGILPLQDDAGGERERRDERAEQGRQHAHPAREREARTGTKPASRRACESETTSENGVKSHGTSVIAKIASEPPTT